MEENRISGALQENVLTLLCFDADAAKIIRNSVTPSLFESSVFKEIALHAIDFLDQFGEPIKDHLPDSLESILKGDDTRKASSFERVIENLYLSKDSVNVEFVLKSLGKFIRNQTLKSTILRAVERIEEGDVDGAENELQKGMNSKLVSFDPGTFLTDTKNSLSFFDIQEQGILTGIEELDSRGITPQQGEVFLFIAPPKKGKSWALTSFGKSALLQRKKVLHISLEMSEARVAQRYVQSFFSITKRAAKVKVPVFEQNSLGQLLGIDYEELERPSLEDPGIRAKVAARLNKEFKNRPPLIIKRFPTGTLTISELKAYLDSLERFQKFVPDVLILDYPDLMQLNGNDIRVSTGQIFKECRGIAVERNLALITATQGNREAATTKVVTDTMVAEDYSKIATADTVITYTQTPQEKKLGIARLFVSNARNDEDKFLVLITQAYSMGQFALDSTYMGNDYWTMIDKLSNRATDDEDEDD